jgi:arylsulfatase
VDDSYKLPFQFTGKIDKLTFNLGPTQLSGDDQKLMRHALEKARD